MSLSMVRVVGIAALLCGPWIAYSQSYFVVVGAFAVNERASEFSGILSEELIDTSYTVPGNDELLQLYVLKTDNRDIAIAKTQQLRKVVELLQEGQDGAQRRLYPEIGNVTVMPSEPETSTGIASAGSSSASAGSPSAASGGNVPPRPVGKYFLFDIEAPDGTSLDGTLHHVDLADGRELARYDAHTFVDLLRPGKTREPMAIAFSKFGYKEVYKFIDYNNPARTDGEAYVDEHGAWVIPYKLERVEKGDVSPMHTVTFHQDAAIMHPSSQTDLDELVRMMHMNPYYEIVIHAHCNGKNRRDILAPGPQRNYFDTAGAVRVAGTAKKLTALRAEAIRAYLMDHGIDPARIEIFPWGTSDMLVDEDSPEASLNDRIEIEFTRD